MELEDLAASLQSKQIRYYSLCGFAVSTVKLAMPSLFETCVFDQLKINPGERSAISGRSETEPDAIDKHESTVKILNFCFQKSATPSRKNFMRLISNL